MASVLTKALEFRRWDGERPYVYTFFPEGELKMFRDEASAEIWADRRGLKAVFVKDEPEPEAVPADGRVDYCFLGITGEEQD
ncbi:TPA: hypothetical protein VDB83_001180 [Burkholderia cenocepacia]|uniref:hypothetical protein n=1 Tax=Burkholderia cenocepacia TaxID=95486 RepID=UPI001B99D0D3|nr:hypothetical protein [Burkholderia cenocepacia]MBR8096340.1 hypothetical protein [Burkholderia cenocepacia]HEP6426909.1 hypothetical protein [Burkholderia cenocepacia]